MKELITPVILGMDFLQGHNIQLDFSTTPISIKKFTDPILQIRQRQQKKQCMVFTIGVPTTDTTIDEAAIPNFSNPVQYDLPSCHSSYNSLVQEYKALFRSVPGKTATIQHFIAVTGVPAKVPPCRVPVQYRQEIEHQIQEMLDWGIIEVSNSPWMAPAVYVQKKSGKLRMCVEYRELNKKTTKDTYPLPLPDEVQDRLCNSSVFTTLDLQCGYWQVPIHEEEDCFLPRTRIGIISIPHHAIRINKSSKLISEVDGQSVKRVTICHHIPR